MSPQPTRWDVDRARRILADYVTPTLTFRGIHWHNFTTLEMAKIAELAKNNDIRPR